jgi:hypothetical protein
MKINRRKYIDGILYKSCECGCGNYFIAGKTTAHVEKRFIVGHNNRNDKEFSEKIRKIVKKKWADPKYKDKMIVIHNTPERKLKQSNIRTGTIMPEEAKRKIGDANRGNIHTEESNNKISIAVKERWQTGDYLLTHSGDKHYNWQGGISFEPYSKDWGEKLKEIIRQRDGYICQVCFISQDKLDIKLSIHHMDYDKKNCNEENLISLCKSCHTKTNHNREQWQSIFASQ